MALSTLDTLTLAPAAAAGLYEVSVPEANALLVEWGHYLGPANRPFGQQAWVFAVADAPVSVAVSASAVSKNVTCRCGRFYDRSKVVELARLASAERWATRVMLRLWREVAAPAWPHWTPALATAYSQNARHEGRIYRFDGWEQASTRAGSNGGGAWSRQRYATDAAHGRKTLWCWHYDDGQVES